MKDFVINSIISYFEFNANYRIEIYTIVNDNMIIPEHLKKTGAGKAMMFVIRSDQNPQAEFDFNRRMLCWNTAFGGNPMRVGIPVDNIVGFGDPFNNFGVNFMGSVGIVPQGQVQQNPIPPQEVKVELKLVVDNKEYNKSEPTGKLKLVVDNTKVDEVDDSSKSADI